MSTKVETEKSPIVNTFMLVVAAALLIAGVVGYYYFQNQTITAVRVVGLMIVVAVASFIAAQSDPGSAFFRFLKESDIERRKVVWPTHQETLQTTLMVIIVTILISLFLAVVDWGLGAAVRSLIRG